MSASNTPSILLEGLEKRFGPVLALAGLDLRLEPGEFVGFCGPNGAGKTTTLRILTGQLAPSAGRVEIMGQPIHQDPRRARALMGYVPESPALYEYLSAREFVSFVAEIRASSPDTSPRAGTVGDQVDEALALAELGDDAERLIREYSQGMRRRVALAAAMVSHPPVLVLDEALNGLDPPSVARIRAELARRCHQGDTVLLSTHVLETLERVADRVVMIAQGRLVADLRPSELGQEGLERLFLERIGATKAP